jgi:protein SCO1/2
MRRHILALAVVALGCEPDAAPTGPSAGAPAASAPTPSTSAQVATAAPPASARPRPPEWKALAHGWQRGNAIPNFELVNQDGERFRLSSFANDYVFIGFIFTTCGVPKACALTTQKMFEVGKLWAARAKAGKTGGKTLHLLTLTIDPENDTPEILRSYGESMRRDVPNWTLATGPEELMQKTLPMMFGVRAAEADGTIAHDVKAALLRPGLRSEKEWKDNGFEPKEIVELILSL